jgi:hypothetical protein
MPGEKTASLYALPQPPWLSRSAELTTKPLKRMRSLVALRSSGLVGVSTR